MSKGKVSLVGGGPGAVDLLTAKGIHCLREADVVIYDWLSSPDLLSLVPSSAELIYAGKRAGIHTLPQEKINQLLVEKARAGYRVVRLKGGDPFIFGRGGEEAEALAGEGIEFEIVPGITSAAAVPAYAGIPLTHRGFSSSVAILTGFEEGGKEESSLDWAKISTGVDTLFFLMGVTALPRIVQNLSGHGRSPDTPVAVIQWGTTARQRTVEGTLDTIVEQVKQAGLRPPAVTVVGDVVSLRRKLCWYESLPLFGKRIVVTRARHQAGRFCERLRELGAQPLEFPVIEILPPESWKPVDDAITRLHTFSWLILTSANGVGFFVDRLFAQGKDVRELKGLRVAAIGSETAAALSRRGLKADLIPDEFKAEGLVASLRDLVDGNSLVLIARAEKAREVLPEELRKMGVPVEVVSIYRTARPRGDWERLNQLLAHGEIDMITFTSSSTVHNFLAALPSENPAELLRGVVIGCIGPITARTVQEYGLEAHVVPGIYTIDAFAQVIAEFFKRERVEMGN